jgi:hypothetical protein
MPNPGPYFLATMYPVEGEGCYKFDEEGIEKAKLILEKGEKSVPPKERLAPPPPPALDLPPASSAEQAAEQERRRAAATDFDISNIKLPSIDTPPTLGDTVTVNPLIRGGNGNGTKRKSRKPKNTYKKKVINRKKVKTLRKKKRR